MPEEEDIDLSDIDLDDESKDELWWAEVNHLALIFKGELFMNSVVLTFHICVYTGIPLFHIFVWESSELVGSLSGYER